MKRAGSNILALFAALAVTGVAKAAPVEVHVTGVESAKGQVVVLACDKSTFLKACPYSAKSPASAGEMVLRIPDVPPGRWAIEAYHDRQNTGHMEHNLIGIPKAVGISGHPSAHFGPPRFDDCAIEVSEAGASVSVPISY